MILTLLQLLQMLLCHPPHYQTFPPSFSCLFFEFILTFGLGPGFVFLRLVIAAALPSGPAADLLFTMMNKQRNFGIGVARGLLSGHCTDEAGYINFI